MKIGRENKSLQPKLDSLKERFISNFSNKNILSCLFITICLILLYIHARNVLIDKLYSEITARELKCKAIFLKIGFSIISSLHLKENSSKTKKKLIFATLFFRSNVFLNKIWHVKVGQKNKLYFWSIKTKRLKFV